MPVKLYMDSRTMRIPRSEKVLGCVGDVRVNIVQFRMARFNDGTDLSGMNLQVHYVNALGDEDYTPATEIEVGEESISFEWRVPVLACKAAGKITASVKARDTQHEFNSGIGEFEVRESYEFDPAGDQLVDDSDNIVVVRLMEGAEIG